MLTQSEIHPWGWSAKSMEYENLCIKKGGRCPQIADKYPQVCWSDDYAHFEMHRIEFGFASRQPKGWPGITRGVEKASLVLFLATLGKAPID